MKQNKIPQDKAKSLLLKLVKAIQYKKKNVPGTGKSQRKNAYCDEYQKPPN